MNFSHNLNHVEIWAKKRPPADGLWRGVSEFNSLGISLHGENLVIARSGFDDLTVHFEVNDEAEELIAIFALSPFCHDWLLVKCSPQTVGIFSATSSATATGWHDRVIAPEFQIGTLGCEGLRAIGQDKID